MKNIGQAIKCLGWDSNQAPPEYKSGSPCSGRIRGDTRDISDCSATTNFHLLSCQNVYNSFLLLGKVIKSSGFCK
jgi:hypothetical protein